MATTKITTASRQAALPTPQFSGQAPYAPSLTGGATSPEARHSRHLRRLYASAVLLSLVALSVSGYLSYVAFTSSKILGCGSGGTFDCGHVLTSKWSTLLGVPVAAWASSLYLSVLVTLMVSARWATSAQPSLMRTWVWCLVTIAGVSAGLAALWFTGLQVFVLKHLCPWCLAAHTCGILLCIATLVFSPLRGQLKRVCTTLGSVSAAGLMTVQVMTPPPPTYTIEEFPATSSQVAGAPVLEASPELFDAPAGDDVFDAPVFDAPSPEASNMEAPASAAPAATAAPATDDEALLIRQRVDGLASNLAWARAATALWLQPASLLTAQVAAADATSAGNAQQAGNEAGSADERLVSLASANLKLRAHQWPMIGSPNAKYIFVELYDYTCPHCRATQQAIRGARQFFKDDLAIITLPVPLSRACNDTVTSEHPSHRESCELAKMAIAVWRIDPAKFAEYHEWLLTQGAVPTAAIAKARAVQLVGQQALDQELAQAHAASFIRKHVEIYRRMGAGPIPKLIFSNTTLTGEVTSPQVLIDTIQRQPAS